MLLRVIVLVGALFLAPLSFAKGDGSNAPWPWPWAKECRIDFEYLGGTYLVKDNDLVEFIEIEVQNLAETSTLYMKISLYDSDFDLLVSGSTYTMENARSIYISMDGTLKEEIPGLRLKLFHRSAKVGCAREQLVPILTVEKSVRDSQEQNQLILEPMSNWDQESP